MIRFVPVPIGNLEDLTIRSKGALIDSEVILCEDTRVTKRLLFLLNISTDDKSFISVHMHNEKEFIETLDIDFCNKNIIFCCDAGMPCVSDPGCLLIDFCIKNNIKYEVLPGANAALLAFCSSGIQNKEFLFYGFLPKKQEHRSNELSKILNFEYASVLYEAPHRIKKLLLEIESIDSKREVFVAKEFTKIFETKYRGTIESVKKMILLKSTKGEWVILIFPKICHTQRITKDQELLTKKDIAKLMSKTSGKPVKDCYSFLSMDS